MPTYYYKTIPLTRIPLEKEPYFTYQSNQEIPWGSLVSIPFGRKKIKGIVFENQSKPTFRTRKITEIKILSALNKKQFSLANKVSKYYFTSVGVVLKLFIFSFTKKELDLPINTLKEKSTIKLTLSQEKTIQKIATSSQNKFLVFGPASSGKTEIAMNLIAKSLERKKQSLVIIPEIFLSYQEIYRYQKRFYNKNLALLHSKLKPSEISTIWRKLKSGEIDILISTKIGCFMPFKNLETIIIDEEQDISHKNWDQSPRYHVGKVANWLAQFHNAKTISLSATPLIENYWKSHEKDKDLEIIKISALKTKKISTQRPTVKIIDLWESKYQRSGDIIFSTPLLKDLHRTFANKKISLILVPYHGKSQAVFCEKCRTVLKCPKCQNSLISTKDIYKCLHCSYKTSSLTSCPNCKNYKLKNIGFGTESVAMEIKKRFPRAEVATINRSNFEKNSVREKLFKQIKDNRVNFLIGTQSIAKGFDFPNINLVAILNAQKWSGKNDFKFDERWLGGLFQVGGRLNRPNSDQKGIFYIQTFKPNSKLLKNIEDWDWEKFSKEELLIRKSLGYPPFGKLYKISFKNFNQEKVEKNSEKVYNQLQKISENEDFALFEPFYGLVKKKGVFWTKHILFKIPQNTQTPKLNETMIKLSSSWSIDPDPENIF